MSWIQENKIPAAILGVTGAGVVGLGVMLFNAWSTAGEAQEEFDAINVSLEALKSGTLSPTPEHLAAKQKLVKDYSDAVGKLSLVLYKLQPEDKPISNTDFQAKLKAKIAEIKKEGAARLPAEFNLAFDQYTNALPKSDQVAAQLSTYLDSVNEIVKMLLKSGVKSIDLLERSDLPSEKDEADKDSSSSADKSGVSITERRVVRVRIRTDQGPLQTLLSNLASPSEMPYFTVVRLLRVENEVQEGPPRVVTAAAKAPEPAQEGAKPTSPGIQPAPADSRVVLGKETLRAYLEIDLVKFLNPQTAASAKR